MHPPALDISMRSTLPARSLWEAVASPEFLGEWWDELEVEPRVGGRIAAEDLPVRKRKSRRASGEVRRIEPGELIRFAWRTKGRDATTVVDIVVSQAKRKSKLRVIESGFDRDETAAIELTRMRDFWRDRLADLQRWLDAPGVAERLDRAVRRDPDLTGCRTTTYRR